MIIELEKKKKLTVPKGLLSYARELRQNNKWGIKKTRDERIWAYLIWLLVNDPVTHDKYCQKYLPHWGRQ